MTHARVPDLEAILARRLSGARRVAVVGIGDDLSRSDRLGILAAREVDALRLPGVQVFLAGTVPEAFTGPIRRGRPDHVLLLDAADMGARPGAAAVIGAKAIGGSRLSTHALPLSLVIDYLEKEAGTPVTLVGLQPDLTASGAGTTAAELAGLTHLVAGLQRVLGRRVAPRPRRHGHGARRSRPPRRSRRRKRLEVK